MNILHSLKHDFLIVGFTGPLRSGCTTAAKYFVKEIDKDIGKKVRNYSKQQTKVEELYKETYKLKSSSGHKSPDKLNKLKNNLRELLKDREVIKVLEDHTENKFAYISMTDMLIKSVIENSARQSYFSSVPPKKLELLEKVHKIIESSYSDLSHFIDFAKLIGERTFLGFEQKDWCDYENYLDRIRKTRSEISKSSADPNLIGDMLQDFGDNLRRCGNPWDYKTQFNGLKPDTIFALAKEANDIIHFYRAREREPKKRVKLFVVEAFRNPYEVEYFRNRYYEFYLVSLFSEHRVREGRGKFSEKRDRRDAGEDVPPLDSFKQNVSSCVRLSDIAINNDKKKEDLFNKLIKYYALIKQPGCFAPEWKETAMHLAYSMSVRSTCICRQVGAVIEGANGYIVGAGWNDVGVGQIGCGYRHYQDFRNLDSKYLISNPIGEDGFRNVWLPSRAQRERESFCYRDEYRDYQIARDVFARILKAKQNILKKLDKGEIKQLAQSMREAINVKIMQYCRSLHAEENAILQTSIIGGMGITEGTIYTTTFPCELCAKKIYQSNIKKVIYTEPYPRSISKDVFFKDGTRKIEFEQFEGVKSPSYFRLYKSAIDKKEFQMLQNLAIKS
jgi:deoxycytidylate deaminase/ElaB/YqjD/DUF883 family membrane-anchored ribosome-binding protein